MTDALTLLCCPRCRGPIVPREERLECGDCSRRYPQVDGMPLLLADPHEELRQWSYRLAELVDEIDGSLDRILAQLAGEGLLSRSRARLRQLHEHLPRHRDRIVELFAGAGVSPKARASKDRPRVPGEGLVASYYPQIHRDWRDGNDGGDGSYAGAREGTPGDEVEAAMAAIESVIPAGASLGRTLVLGAGPARITYELARRHGACPVVALDLNPLPYLVAARVLRGETVQLYEMPEVPLASTDVLVDRSLRVPGEIPDGLSITLAFADGLDPPVPEGAFDTVVTPWFIDQIPHDLRDLLPVLHRALAAGGAWLNHGPYIYHPNHTRLAHRYREDEVLELVAASGFQISRHDHRLLPYMFSPVSAQGRMEMVSSFWAKKVELPARASATEPAWLTDIEQPVPRLAGIEGYVAPHPMFAAVIALVDGRRSVAEIAAHLVRSHRLPETAATAGVAGCLREIWRALAEA